MRAAVALAVLAALLPAAPAAAAVPPGSWAPPRVLSDPETSVTRPRVVVHEGGLATVVWKEPLANRLVWSSRDLSGSWSAPARIPGSDGVEQLALTTGAAGREVVLFSATTPGGVVVRASSRLGLGYWSEAPANVSQPWTSVRSLQAVRTPSGEVVAAWAASSSSGVGIVESSTLTPIGQWRAPVTISQAGTIAQRPVVAVDGVGQVTAAFHCASCDTVQAATRTPGGTWSPAVTVSNPSQIAFAPFVAADPGGDVAVSWMVETVVGTEDRAYVQVARRRAGQPWSPPVGLTPPTLLDGASVALVNGVVHVVWGELVDGVPNLRVRRAVGEVWQPTETVVSSDGLGDAFAISTSDGDLALMWQDETVEHGSHLWSRTWSSGGWTPVVELAEDVRTLSWATAPEGEAMLVWEEQSMTVPHGLIHSRALDATPPVITSLDAPATAVAGTPVSLSVAATDRWSGIGGVHWRFPDGTVRSGTTVAHTFAGPGDQPITLTVVDGVGRSTTRSLVIPVTPLPAVLQTEPPQLPPRLMRLDLTRHRIEVRSPRRRLTRTKVVVRLSTDATVRFALVRKGSRKPALRFARALDAGANRFRLTARVRGKTLRPGVYRLVARAVNDAGSSERRRVRLVVVR